MESKATSPESVPDSVPDSWLSSWVSDIAHPPAPPPAIAATGWARILIFLNLILYKQDKTPPVTYWNDFRIA